LQKNKAEVHTAQPGLAWSILCPATSSSSCGGHWQPRAAPKCEIKQNQLVITTGNLLGLATVRLRVEKWPGAKTRFDSLCWDQACFWVD